VVEASLLPGLIGPARTRKLLLTGDNISAAEALAWGLVDEVAPADQLDAAVEKLTASILASGPAAVRLQKSLVLDWEEMHTAAAVDRGIDGFVEAFATDEPRRMVSAARAAMQARRKAR
jgi:enoyl-CoA hydratase/carnithine racemase